MVAGRSSEARAKMAVIAFLGDAPGVAAQERFTELTFR
jgi:hypothetical protein